MSALSPASARTSGVRWSDLPTSSESALPSCCLSYKQSAFWSPLCFQLLADSLVFPNRVKSFAINQIPTLSTKHPGWGAPDSLSSALQPPPFVLRFSCSCAPCIFSNLQPLSLSWPSFSNSCRLFSEAYSLFCQKQGGGGGVVNLPMLARPQCAAWESTQCLIWGSRRLRGTAPCSSTESWKARMLNLAPRRRSASARSSLILSWPSL